MNHFAITIEHKLGMYKCGGTALEIYDKFSKEVFPYKVDNLTIIVKESSSSEDSIVDFGDAIIKLYYSFKVPVDYKEAVVLMLKRSRLGFLVDYTSNSIHADINNEEGM